MSGMKGKQEQGQKKTQSVSQLVLKIEEQRQQINQMDTVFFETQDKCEELQNKLNAMQLQLQQAKSQALSNVKLDFDPHIVQLIKDVSFECDMNQQAIDALGLQFNDFVTIFNTFLPQDLELDTKNINFIRQIKQKYEFCANSTTLQQLVTDFDNQFEALSKELAEKNQLLIQKQFTVQSLEFDNQKLTQNLQFQQNLQQKQTNDRSELLILIQQQANEISKFRDQYKEKEELFDFYKTEAENLKQQLEINQQTLEEYKKILYQEADQEEQQHDVNESLKSLIDKQNELKQQLNQADTYTYSLQDFLDQTITKAFNYQINDEITKVNVQKQDNYYQVLTQDLLEKFAKLAQNFNQQNLNNNTFINQIESEYISLQMQLNNLSASDKSFEIAKLLDQIEYLQAENLDLKRGHTQLQQKCKSIIQESVSQFERLSQQQKLIDKDVSMMDTDSVSVDVSKRLQAQVEEIKSNFNLYCSDSLKLQLSDVYREVVEQTSDRVFRARMRLFDSEKRNVQNSLSVEFELQQLEKDVQSTLERMQQLTQDNTNLQSKILSQAQLTQTSSQQTEYAQSLIAKNEALQTENQHLRFHSTNLKEIINVQNELKTQLQKSDAETENLNSIAQVLNEHLQQQTEQTIEQLARVHCTIKQDNGVKINREIQAAPQTTISEAQTDSFETATILKSVLGSQGASNIQQINKTIKNALQRSISPLRNVAELSADEDLMSIKTSKLQKSQTVDQLFQGQLSQLEHSKSEDTMLLGTKLQLERAQKSQFSNFNQSQSQNQQQNNNNDYHNFEPAQFVSSQIFTEKKPKVEAGDKMQQLKQKLLGNKTLLQGIKVDRTSVLDSQIRKAE
ncbi:Conserved_hypothetical protein [Hexamita inflata]|uniref:Uncharacterized protein n=2 Tax=Hexamita inflata TaxID=28002 RepID=A0AA86QCC4_9EUKA|nr:Conserved hypothetical protein [Hexamita inflata]